MFLVVASLDVLMNFVLITGRYGFPRMGVAGAAWSVFKRVGTVGDVADVVSFLASEQSRWVTGGWIDATGGSLL